MWRHRKEYKKTTEADLTKNTLLFQYESTNSSTRNVGLTKNKRKMNVRRATLLSRFLKIYRQDKIKFMYTICKDFHLCIAMPWIHVLVVSLMILLHIYYFFLSFSLLHLFFYLAYIFFFEYLLFEFLFHDEKASK